MSKKRRNKNQQPIETKFSEAAILPDGPEANIAKGKDYKLQVILIFLFSFFLYIQTVNYQYALDDKLVITHNSLTKKGFSGIGELMTTDFLVGFFGKQKNLLSGGRYRPLSLVTFAVEWGMFMPSDAKNNINKYPDKLNNLAGFSHGVNTLFYAFICVFIFIILNKLFPKKEGRPWYLSFAFIATMLFTAHPLHTEAIANIKGRDELMSLFGAFATLYLTLKYLDKGDKKYMIYSCIALFLALLSKETSVTFLAVIPLTIYYFTNKSIKQNAMSCLPLYITLIGYIIVRIAVLGMPNSKPIPPEIMNNPFLYATSSQKFATIFYTMGLYIKLLFFPHPLTHDYYPWHPLGAYIAGQGGYPYLSWGNFRSFIPLFGYGFLIFVAIKGLKTKSIVSYGIWFYLITFSLVTNLIFPVGTFMNERFMFAPSLGFTIIIAHFLVNYLPEKIKSDNAYKSIVMGIVTILLVGYSAKTVSRNRSWKNDSSLSVGDVKVSFWSAKSNMSAGLALVDDSKLIKDPIAKSKMLDEAIEHLTLSLKIYPTYIQPMLIKGNAYYEKQDYMNAILYFENCLHLNPQYEYSLSNLRHIGDLCTRKGNAEQDPNKKLLLFKSAIKSWETLIKYDKKNEVRVYSKLGELYGKDLHDATTSLKYLKKAFEIDPNNSDVLQKLGVVYAMTGRPQDAIKIFEKALEKDTTNARIIMNIGVAYNSMGQLDLGNKYLQKAFTLDPKLNRNAQ